ncbi:MAG: bifunctional (p)ppGpp synthetase/guanosine-3',5'-bis(diphosphate) 3'-pyrophosphohydrolase [Fibrobacteraceae bacterium]|nr:bifunctional (p)ppGpp synthetase/guanosine-3',5'-bis(diphosphate) 3'-pyrophosphohydrolase [Fibrobacteraceae bacterium]
MEPAKFSTNQEHIVSVLLKKNPDLDEGILRTAIAFIADAHSGQYRKSGMPYTEHPFEVAKILADLKQDQATVLAGLLHDVVEDTPHTLDEISEKFGQDTAFMVDAVTKITEAQEASKTAQKAETYRKLITAMAKDPRVIMIKIADRIHNMRTMRYMKPEKRKLIAQETLDIYIPLTHRFGLYKLKTELEDLSFKYVNPDEYKKIVDELIGTKESREKYIQSVIGPLQFKMMLEEFDCAIQGRTKNIYSIYNKMIARNCQFEDIFDIFAIRIVVETIPECYLALGYVHNLWTPLQSRFKDYIATPKPNLYQSIHTTVIGPENKMVEVQIRTKDMDVTAEKGFAAHWAYKLETQHEGEELAWLNHMVKLQDEIKDSREYLDFLRIDLKPEGMTVFTPKGNSIELPEGSTVLDFAFAVHTELGLHCIGARINEEVFSIDKVVPHGATIQILKSPHQEPSPEWLDLVKTAKAKQELRRWMKTSINQQARALGKEIWVRELRIQKIDKQHAPKEEDILRYFGYPTIDAFYECIGQGELPLQDIHRFISPESSIGKETNALRFFPSFSKDSKNKLQSAMPLQIGLETSLVIHFASCCAPIPGDTIVGWLRPQKGIEVHKSNCPELKKAPIEQQIAVNWSDEINKPFSAHLTVVTDNRQNITLEILQELKVANVFLDRMSVASVKSSGRIRLEFKAFRKEQLDSITNKISQISGVREVKKI